MPLKIESSLYKSQNNQVVNTALQEQILAILGDDDGNAYSAPEIAAAFRALVGLPEKLRAVFAVLGLFSNDIAQLNASVHSAFEVAINALRRDGRIKAFIHQGTAYFSAKSSHQSI